jgi:CDP-paratose 2-epimerase
MREEGNFAGRRRKQRLEPRMMHAETDSQPLLENTAEKTIGLAEWFRPGEYEQVERALADCRVLGVKALRTAVSWADWHTRAGQEWYTWLLPHLAAEVNLLPCFLYTPPSLGVEPKTAAPPRNPQAYADFLDQMMTLFGAYFEWVELWNEPNNLLNWDWRLDPKWRIFNEMIGRAAYWAQHCGKKTVLAGMCPTDPHWLALMCERGVMQYIDVVGVHGFPGTWELG